MNVKAANGLRLPKEGKPRQYITDAETVSVPETAYYLRAVACGDLVRVPESATAKPAKAAPQAEAKE